MSRIVCWFSCGATSAVAAYLTIKKHGADAVTVAYIDTGSEHEDNVRFLRDVERWLGVPVLVLKNEKYANVDEVIERTRYIRGQHGARCSGELKRAVRLAFQQPGDLQIFGYHAKERRRAARFTEANIGIDLWYPLIDAELTHDDCLALIQEVGIELPEMYKLGYNNNNCLGCVKAEGAVYWNRIRRDFPEVFARRAAQERGMGYAMVRINHAPIFLDELDPALGDMSSEPVVQCGLLCQIALTE
jgi:3'-phosphoadenosine 5'-phosphosulfate sulfotransferase (PAPS reductase)/FAD synthetase